MIRSGLAASARNTPGRPLRSLTARRAARLGLRPCEGGIDELSGVLWPAQPCLEFGDPSGQFLDLGRLGQHQRDQRFFG